MTQENKAGPDVSGTKLIEGDTLTYLLRLPAEVSDKPVPTLLLMHGRGANEGDVFELTQYIDRRFMIIAPRAPMKFSDDPRGSFMWYDNIEPGVAVPGSLETAVQKVVDFMGEVEQSAGVKIDRNQLYIGGFSQGAAMSYALIRAYPDMAAGVMAHSSPFREGQEAELRQVAAKLKGKPFFVAHGTGDFLNIDEHGRRAARFLREIGADLTYKEYSFAHETSPQSRQDLADWLNPRLG